MIYRFEDFILDTDRHELTRAGDALAIEPQVFALLALLVTNPGRMIPKDEIIEQVWNGRIVSDGSLNSRIRSLRKVLDDDGQQQRLIKTVHGQGFRFVGVLDDQSSQTPAAAPQSSNDGPANIVGAAGIVVPQTDIPVVAVLPFDNMSSDPEQDHLADGICEDILTILSKISGLQVIGRNSSFAYRGKALDLRQIGQELGASHLLEGSVRRSGRKLRVTGQLIDAATGTHLWAERFDREIDDFFAIQDEMTRQIAQALQVSLIEGDIANYWSGGTKNFEAWWLQAQAMPAIIRTHDLTSILQGRKFAKEALQLDGEYAEAWATLGLSHFFELAGFWAKNPEKAVSKGAECYDRAYLANPANPLIQAGKALAEIHRNNHDQGIALMQQARAAAPNNVQIRIQGHYAKLYCSESHHGSNVSEKIRQNLPLLASAIYLMSGEMELALHYAQTNIERIPDELQGYALALAAQTALGQSEEAKQSLQRIKGQNPEFAPTYYRFRFPQKDAAAIDRIEGALASAGIF